MERAGPGTERFLGGSHGVKLHLRERRGARVRRRTRARSDGRDGEIAIAGSRDGWFVWVGDRFARSTDQGATWGGRGW